MAVKRITQKEAVQILTTYCVRKNEFEYKGITKDKEYTFLHKTIRGYMLTIGNERMQYTGEWTGRIIVRHTSEDGRIAFTDIWVRDKKGILLFQFRNPAKLPPADQEYIKQLEQEIEELKKAGRELKERTEKVGSSFVAEKKNARGAGRKPDPQRREELAGKLEKLLEEGKKEKEIMKEMGISRPTYYRYKRMVKQKNK